MDNELLLNKLKKDLKTMKRELKYYKLYSLYRRGVVPLGSSLLRLYSYILASTIAFNCASICKMTPFKVESHKVKTYNVDTSTGLHFKKEIENNIEKNCSFKHTTGWHKNELGVYEQIITNYEIDENIDLNNIEYLLSLKEEEIDKLLVVKNVEKIQKNNLNEEDYLYNEEMLIIENIDENSMYYNFKIDLVKDLFELAFFIGLNILILKVFKKVNKVVFKNKIDIYLDGINNIYDYNVVELEEIIKIKEDNIKLIEDNNVKIYNYKTIE